MKVTDNSDLTLCTANVNTTGLAPAQPNCQHNFTFRSARTVQLSAQLYVPLCTHSPTVSTTLRPPLHAQSNCQHNFTSPSARIVQLSAQLYVPLYTHSPTVSTTLRPPLHAQSNCQHNLRSLPHAFHKHRGQKFRKCRELVCGSFIKTLPKVGRYVHRLIKCQMSRTHPSSLRFNFSSSVWQQEQPRTKDSLSK